MSAPAQASAELLIGWADAIKLAVPFVTAILLVWIKQWIEGRLARQRKQRALWRLVVNELASTHDTVRAFKGIGRSAQMKRLRLVGLTTPALLSTLARELADLDPSNAFVYADLDAWVTIVSNGLERLASLQMTRVSASEEIVPQLDRVIFGQARITASDSVSLSVAAIKALKIIPLAQRDPVAPGSTLESMERVVAQARADLDSWSRFDVPIVVDEPADGTREAARPGPDELPPVAQAPMLPRLHPGDDEFVDAGG